MSPAPTPQPTTTLAAIPKSTRDRSPNAGNTEMRIGSFLAGFIAFAVPCTVQAFPHIVKPGESLAQIALRVYGDPKLEVVLAGANALASEGGSAPVAGMRLEIPAPRYHHVA